MSLRVGKTAVALAAEGVLGRYLVANYTLQMMKVHPKRFPTGGAALHLEGLGHPEHRGCLLGWEELIELPYI